MLYSFHEVGYVPKSFAKEVEQFVKVRLSDTKEVTIQELALMVKVFCSTRTAERDFHKLLETTILIRMPDLRKDFKVLHAIGYKFEESGLCSLDTMKALKKEVFQIQVENEVFE